MQSGILCLWYGGDSRAVCEVVGWTAGSHSSCRGWLAMHGNAGPAQAFQSLGPAPSVLQDSSFEAHRAGLQTLQHLCLACNSMYCSRIASHSVTHKHRMPALGPSQLSGSGCFSQARPYLVLEEARLSAGCFCMADHPVILSHLHSCRSQPKPQLLRRLTPTSSYTLQMQPVCRLDVQKKRGPGVPHRGQCVGVRSALLRAQQLP